VEIVSYLQSALAAYLVGSIPTGYIFARARGVDIRKVGSGNIGATNVFRTMGKTAGIAVLLFDAIKGYVPARFFLFGSDIQTREYHAMVAGFFAILGHNYTCWLKFKGGKGIATSAGVLAAWAPYGFLTSLGIWILMLAFTRYVSIASITAAAVLPFAVWITGGSRPMIGLTSVVGALAIYKHKTNIQRLLNGTEHRFGIKKAEAGDGGEK
jgi:glycerol-3-phosphate acyltransferase PlsY